MAELTKEWLLTTIAELEEERDATPGVVNVDVAIALAAMKLALASLEAEAVAWLLSGGGAKNHVSFDSGNAYADPLREVTPLYTAPPAPVSVPEPIKRNDADGWWMYKGRRVGGGCAEWYNRALDDCRAAMLYGADVSLTHEGKNHHEDKLGMVNHLGDVTEKVEPVTQIEPVADLYGLTSPTGGETSFTFDAVEARDFIDGGWSCQEYVELERFQEAVSGNSPAIPDGWVMVPEDPTHEMLEAGDEQFGTYDVYRRMIEAAPKLE